MPNRLLPCLLPLALLLLATGARAQCTVQEATPQGFVFCYSGDTVRVTGPNCTAPLDLVEMNPFNALVSVQTPPNGSASFFGLSTALTGYAEDDPVPGGTVLDVFYILNGSINGATSVVDTFQFTLRFSDALGPVFTNFPADTIVQCAGDLPPVPALDAVDGCDGLVASQVLPDTIPNGPGGCAGGTVTYRYTAADNEGNTTTQDWVVTVAPDMEAPVFAGTLADLTEQCDTADYALWLSTTAQNFADNTTDNCGVDTLYHDGPSSYADTCGTLVVTFTAADACGNTTSATADYTRIDNVAPSISNLPSTPDTIAAGSALPPFDTLDVSDNCAADPTVTFLQSSTQGDGGPCSDFTYTVDRTYNVSDGCGNLTQFVKVIRVIDNEGPTFLLPTDTLIACNAPTDPASTGAPTNLTDNADPAPVLTFTDELTGNNCQQAIIRSWIAVDACGNETRRNQLINIRDTLAPTFIVPTDRTVSCELVNDSLATGIPTQVADNCTLQPAVSIANDAITPGNCPNNYTIVRTWRVVDGCGNSREQDQVITVEDNTLPQVIAAPQDLTLPCSDTLDADLAFQQWLDARGGAQLTDNCATGLQWVFFNAGTSDFASLPPAACPSPQFGTVRRQTVDFIASDGCANTRSFTATFRVTDNEAPQFLACVPDTTLAADAACEAVYRLPVPAVRDNCGGIDSLVVRSAQATLTAPTLPTDPLNSATPVDTVRLSLAVPAGPTAASDAATLSILLENADAEAAEEYFRVFAEDGTPLGQTDPVPTQCADGTTTLTVSQALLNTLTLDGTVGLTLVPHVPTGQPGTFAVNNVCGTTTVTATLSYPARVSASLRYSYRVDGGGEVFTDPTTPVDLTLAGGAHTITSLFTDCAGRRDSCAHTVTVADVLPPMLTCPADTVVFVGVDSCAKTLDLPLPAALTDGCRAGAVRSLGTGQRALTFAFDPNLNQYTAEPQTLAIANAAADALVQPVTLTFRWRADTEASDERFQLLDENNELVLTSPTGGCGQVGETSVLVPAAQFNTWAADGTLVFSVQPQAGIPGSTDGINPCNPGVVSADGDDDAISFVQVELAYESTSLSYRVDGATSVSDTPTTAAPTVTLATGPNQITYTTTDAAGNAASCSYQLTVRDTVAPVAVCTPSFVAINPAGAALTLLDPALIDGGSSDNCGIDTSFVSPAAINCNQVGDTVSVTLTVVDAAGNSASCNTFVAVRGIAPQPDYAVDCALGTLSLFANPPPALGSVFQYTWTGPNNFQSNLQDPVINGANAADAGFYTVTITGVTGCTATGTVQVVVTDLPPAVPQLVALQDSVCGGAALRFDVLNPQPGDTYTLYDAQDNAVGTFTQLPIELPNANPLEGDYCYSLTTTRNACTSARSATRCVFVTVVADALLAQDELIRCSGEQLVLEAVLPTGPDVIYQWVGPNFNQTGPQSQVVLFDLAATDDGIYLLSATRNGCASVPDTATVFVLDTPAKPTLFSNSTPTAPVCEGETLTLSTNAISGNAQYTWQLNGGLSYQTQAAELVLADVSPGLGGSWTVRIEADNGCRSPTSDPVQVMVAPRPQLSAGADPTMICNGDDLQLFASSSPPAATYSWTGPNGFASVLADPELTNVTNAAQGDYRVVVTTAAGCTDSTTVTVGSNSAITITSVSDNGSNCPTGPEAVTLTATVFPLDSQNDYTYRWTRNGILVGTEADLLLPEATPADNGTYQLVVVSPAGCASDPFPYNLVIGEPTPTPAQPQPDAGAVPCAGGSLTLILPNANYSGTVEYLWTTPNNGVQTTTDPSLLLANLGAEDAGNYTLRVSVNGCVSPPSAPLVLTVTAQPVAIAGSNAPVCSGEQLQLSVQAQAGATYTWTGPNNFTATVAEPIINNADAALHNGSYEVVLTNAAGCASEPATINVLVLPTPAAPVLTGITSLCGTTDSLHFTVDGGPAGSQYEWRADGSPVELTADTFLVLPNIYNDGASPVFRVVRIVSGCRSLPSNAVTVSINTVPNNNAVAGPDQVICATTATLSATAPSTGTGAWSQTGGPTGAVIANPDAAQTTVNNLQLGAVYTFRWSLSNGACTDYSSDDVTVDIRATNSIDGGPNIDTCGVDAVTLLGQLPAVGVGTWTQPPVQELLGVYIAAPNAPDTEVGNFEPGNTYFFYYGTDSDCGEVRDTVQVFIRADQADAGADIEDCGDGCVPLSANLNFSENGRWLSPDAALTFDDATDPLTTVCNLQVGDNLLVWELNGGRCGAASYDTLVVVYLEAAEAVDDNFVLVIGEPLTFNVLDNDVVRGTTSLRVVEAPASGQLRDDGNGQFTYTASLAAADPVRFVYELCSAACGCSEATVELVTSTSDNCLPPTLITPNGDGVNDLFFIECLFKNGDFPDNQLTIFNEWGGVVFEAAPYTNDWAGTYQGNPLPAGTYFYVFEPGSGRAPISDFLVIQ